MFCLPRQSTVKLVIHFRAHARFCMNTVRICSPSHLQCSTRGTRQQAVDIARNSELNTASSSAPQLAWLQCAQQLHMNGEDEEPVGPHGSSVRLRRLERHERRETSRPPVFANYHRKLILQWIGMVCLSIRLKSALQMRGLWGCVVVDSAVHTLTVRDTIFNQALTVKLKARLPRNPVTTVNQQTCCLVRAPPACLGSGGLVTWARWRASPHIFF